MDQIIYSIINNACMQIDPEQSAAIILVGSYARNEAYINSDIDLIFLGDGIPYKLIFREKQLISISWKSEKTIYDGFNDPSIAGASIPSFRNCIIIRDKNDIANRIIDNANKWTWSIILDKCSPWIAEQITGLAEEVHRLVDCINNNNQTMAAVARSIIALRIPIIMSVHLNLLYESENKLWDMINTEMGKYWTRIQKVALGINNDDFKSTCYASLELYSMASKILKQYLDNEQLIVIQNACEISGYPI